MWTFRLEVLNMYTYTPTYSETYVCIHTLKQLHVINANLTRASHVHISLCTHVDRCVCKNRY